MEEIKKKEDQEEKFKGEVEELVRHNIPSVGRKRTAEILKEVASLLDEYPRTYP